MRMEIGRRVTVTLHKWSQSTFSATTPSSSGGPYYMSMLELGQSLALQTC